MKQNKKQLKSEYDKIYREKNHSKLCEQDRLEYQNKKEEIKRRMKKYYEENREKRLKYYYDNAEDISFKRKIYNKEKRKQIQKKSSEYHKNRRKKDLSFKLATTLRNRIHSVLKGQSKSASTVILLGCSIEQFKNYIKSLFKSGMTWSNYGYRGWHIDHIKPCASFDLSKPEEQKKCFHFSNLQPLWMEENLKKNRF